MFPHEAMTIRGSHVGTLSAMHDIMAIIKAGKVMGRIVLKP